MVSGEFSAISSLTVQPTKRAGWINGGVRFDRAERKDRLGGIDINTTAIVFRPIGGHDDLMKPRCATIGDLDAAAKVFARACAVCVATSNSEMFDART